MISREALKTITGMIASHKSMRHIMDREAPPKFSIKSTSRLRNGECEEDTTYLEISHTMRARKTLMHALHNVLTDPRMPNKKFFVHIVKIGQNTQTERQWYRCEYGELRRCSGKDPFEEANKQREKLQHKDQRNYYRKQSA